MHCFRRLHRQICLLIRFARFCCERRNPLLPERFSPFSPTWCSLSWDSAWVLSPVLEKLLPPASSSELLSGLVLELALLLLQESGLASPVLLLAPVSE